MLSGIKPSGDLTLGSYLGAIRNWKDRADEFDCFYFLADLHTITVRQDPADLRRRSLERSISPAALTRKRTSCSSRAMCTSTPSWAGCSTAMRCSAS